MNTPYSLPEICTSTTWIDWSGLSRLSGVLCKYPGILESLEELKIYVEPHEFLPEEEEDFDDDLDVGSIWYFATEAGPWHKMEDQLVHDGGPLQGWRISRSVRLKVHRRPRRRRGTDDHKNIVVSCASEFRKVSTPKSVDEDEDVNADTSTYPITLDFEYY